MLQGKSIVELATEIERQANARADYRADTREMTISENATKLSLGDDHEFSLTNHTHRQIGGRLGIPAAYYDTLQSKHPALLEENINYLFQHQPETRMVRTLDGSARAFLSDRYRRIDNDEIASVILPILMETPEIRIISSEITERRLYLQAVFPRLEGEVKVGDPVQAGITITNSEIGLGGFNISDLIYRLVCTNGMIGQHALKKYHVGRQSSNIEDSYEIFKDETIRADDHALMLKVRDTVRAAMDEARFHQYLEKLKDSTKTSEIENPVKAIELLGSKVGLAETERNSVLRNIIKGGDLSKYGLVQAVTAVANDHESYDRAVEFEQLGGKVLDLNKSQWREIAEAA